MTLELLDYPHQEIWMYCDSDTERRMRLQACQKEPETTEWISSLPAGSVLYDIGANCGSYALLAGSLGLKVYAFEPAPFNFQRLVENIEANGLQDRVTPIQMALSDDFGTCGFDWSSEEPGAASHTQIPKGDIPTVRLDSLKPVPDYIKIDVDGHELAVIRGGVGVWPKIKSLQVEIDDSLPDWRQIIYLLCTEAGFKIQKWSRHGSGNISNVLFSR